MLSGRRRPRRRSISMLRARGASAHAPARAQAAMMDFGELFVAPVCTEHRVGSEELAANGGEDSAAGNHEVRCVLGDARWATRRPDAGDATTRRRRARRMRTDEIFPRDRASRSSGAGRSSERRGYNQVSSFELNGEEAREGKGGARDGGSADGLRILRRRAPFGEDVPEQFRNSALEYELRLYTGRVARWCTWCTPSRESRHPAEKVGVHDSPVLLASCRARKVQG